MKEERRRPAAKENTEKKRTRSRSDSSEAVSNAVEFTNDPHSKKNTKNTRTSEKKTAREKTKASVNKVSGVAVTEGSNYYSPRYLEVSWNSINQASGYEIWRKTGSKGKYKKITTGASPVSSSGKKVKLFYRDDSIQEGNTYSYKVRPYRIISGKKKNGAFSKPVSKRIG